MTIQALLITTKLSDFKGGEAMIPDNLSELQRLEQLWEQWDEESEQENEENFFRDYLEE